MVPETAEFTIDNLDHTFPELFEIYSKELFTILVEELRNTQTIVKELQSTVDKQGIAIASLSETVDELNHKNHTDLRFKKIGGKF